jgi:hypothetical protein
MAVRISSGSSSGGTYPPAGGVSESDLATTVQTKLNDVVTKSLVDVKGDLIVATGSDTVARVPIGANNTVLTANSATSSGVSWVTLTGGNGVQYIDAKSAPYNAALNGTSNDQAAIQAAIDAAAGTNLPVLIAGVAGISAPLQLKSEMGIASLGIVNWPYPLTGSYTPKSGLKIVGTFSGGDCMIEVGNGVQWAYIREIDLNGNSQPATGTQVGGVYFTGSARSIKLDNVGAYQTSGHGFMSRQSGGNYPRGLELVGCRSWSAGNASGANADGTQWGFTFDHFTDSSLNRCESKDSRNGGFRIDGAGDTTLTDCRAPFNRGGPGFYITGGDPTLATGNGSIRLNGCSSDRNFAEGLLVDATGRQVVQVDNFTARRDGANNETGTPTAAGISISGATTSARVAPTFLNNVATVVEDDDNNNVFWTSVNGLYLQNITELSLCNSHIWGLTSSIVQGTGSTGGRVKSSSSNWFYTGNPTAKTIVTPTIT